MIESIFILWNLNIILESLPISSSGHLKLFTHVFSDIPTIKSSTEHLMHIPNSIIISIFLITFTPEHLTNLETMRTFFLCLLITNAITGCAYLLLKPFCERVPLGLGFLVSATALMSLAYTPAWHYEDLHLVHGFLIGLAQTFALIPGVSRMALTTTTGIWLGLDPHVSFAYSLACELALIFVAVAAAFYQEGITLFKGLSIFQLIVLSISTIVSYGALVFSAYSFIHYSVPGIGWYLLAVAAYTGLFL